MTLIPVQGIEISSYGSKTGFKHYFYCYTIMTATLPRHETPHDILDRTAESKQKLYSAFAPVVGRIALPELVIMHESRKEPRSLGQFSLLPFIGKPGRGVNGAPGENYSLPAGVRATYGTGGNNRPYLDAEFSLGLLRNDWLVALAASDIDPDGNIFIKQIQDVSGTSSKYGRTKRGEHFKTGLHDGFLWRDTLIAGWIQTALDSEIGDKVLIQGSFNNYWLDRVPAAQLEKAYDHVAGRMGFVENEKRNWEAELYANELVWPEFPG
jgi:hypothetical protein